MFELVSMIGMELSPKVQPEKFGFTARNNAADLF